MSATMALPSMKMTGKSYRALTVMHARLLLREPGAFAFLVLPTVLLAIFGNIPAFKTPQPDLGGRTVLDVYVPTIAAIVPLLLALTVLPGAMAMFREKNALRRFSVTPVSPAAMLAALLAVVVGLAVIGVAAVIAAGWLIFHVTAPSSLGAVISSFVLGSTAVLALGLIVSAVSPTGGVANGVGVPIMIVNFFFSGLYTPVAELPRLLQQIGEFVPFGAVMDAWSGEGRLWQHLLVLAGYTLVGGIAAAKLFRWE
jgi:ABC-2 type transport system permease protein